MNLQISYNELYNTLSHSQLVLISKSIGITCYAECLNEFAIQIYKLSSLPRSILCNRLLDYYLNGTIHVKPVQINPCHYSSSPTNVFALDNYVLINQFSTNNWNCTAFLRKCGIHSSTIVNDLVTTLWTSLTHPFTYRDLQLYYIKHIANESNRNILNTYSIESTCNKLLQHSFNPCIKLIRDNNNKLTT